MTYLLDNSSDGTHIRDGALSALVSDVAVALPVVYGSDGVSAESKALARSIRIRMMCDTGSRVAPSSVSKCSLVKNLREIAKSVDSSLGGEFAQLATLIDGEVCEKFAMSQTLDMVSVEVVKGSASEDEMTVMGIVLEPETVDAQKDIYSEEEIRKTAYRFMEDYQQFGLQHTQMLDSVAVLESYIAPVDFVVEGQSVKKGSWVMTARISDASIWQDIKSGKITGYSIGGEAFKIRLDVEE